MSFETLKNNKDNVLDKSLINHFLHLDVKRSSNNHVKIYNHTYFNAKTFKHIQRIKNFQETFCRGER